ncbi:uncharacterized protein [Lolium perenne]|uniref:uncharacterized protein n=1 Tax=Lolium perenne TaxID=4522 RepID=UPI0021EB1E8B|nr:zinc finger protein 11-like [Lolium perenne]
MAANYYWGMWGAGATATTFPAPAATAEPSWEEQAFARDAAGHLGAGCVWPPRSYTCTFCRREFRSAQALGGHMNVHRRDRARLRQCASPPDHREQPLPTSSSHDHHETLQPERQYRAAVSPISPQDQQATVIGASTTSPSYISTIIMESRNTVFISMPDDAMVREAWEGGDEERRKRRRVDDQPPAVALPFFVRLSPASSGREGMQGADDGDAKVSKVVPSPSTLHLAVGQQEVDLELRLGTS